MRIEDGSQVEVANQACSGVMKVKVTDLIHPDAVFMVHGFGHTLPVESRRRDKGVADHLFMPGGLDILGSGRRRAGPPRALCHGEKGFLIHCGSG